MKKVHIANTHFEEELAAAHRKEDIEAIKKSSGMDSEAINESISESISRALSAHPIFAQLQFLPLLTANPEDSVAVSYLPESQYWERLEKISWLDKKLLPKVELLSALPKDPSLSQQKSQLFSWGASASLSKWAQNLNYQYAIAPLDVVKKVNSKLFSFQIAPPLNSSCLLESAADLQRWIGEYGGKKVLKTCLGVAGRGHFFLFTPDKQDAALSFCQTEWQQGRAVIGEPWVDRLLDFSTQWLIAPQKEIQFLGAAIVENDANGSFQRALVGPEYDLFRSHHRFLGEHLIQAMEILPQVQKEGYFGPLGIDAMVYRKAGDAEAKLQPIVEINARETMSLYALKMQKRYFPGQAIALSYEKELADREDGLLPQWTNQKASAHKRQLYVQPL